MADAAVTKEGLVNLRGVFLPVDDIRAAMLETGGTVVADRELNAVLDKAMSRAGKGVDALVVDSVQGYYFVPIWMRIYNSPILDGVWLYFGVKEKTIYA